MKKYPKVTCLVCGKKLHFGMYRHPICSSCEYHPPQCIYCSEPVYYCNGKWYHVKTKRSHCFNVTASPTQRNMALMLGTAMHEALDIYFSAKIQPEPLGADW